MIEALGRRKSVSGPLPFTVDLDGGSVWIRMAADRATAAATATPAGSGVGAGRNRIGVELVFRGTEDNALHRAGEGPIAPGRRTGKRDLHGMVVVLVLVDQHHRP